VGLLEARFHYLDFFIGKWIFSFAGISPPGITPVIPEFKRPPARSDGGGFFSFAGISPVDH